jgi:hypothetical protein
MAKREVKTDKIRTPSGVFSQATVIEGAGAGSSSFPE